MFKCVRDKHLIKHYQPLLTGGKAKSFKPNRFLISRSLDVTKPVDLSPVRDCAVTDRVCETLAELLTHGAGKLLKQAVEAEADAFIDERRRVTDECGRRRVVCNGYLAPRKIHTCMGENAVSVPRVRDLAGKIKYKSRILMPYQRYTEGQKEQFSRAYLAGVASGDFYLALLALLGRHVPCMSPTAVTRLKALWRGEHLRGLDHEFPGGRAPICGTLQTRTRNMDDSGGS
jgi:hypothetical protein